MALSPSVGTALPLSAAQQEIWFAEERWGTRNWVYNIGEYLTIEGPVDPAVFEAALRWVVDEVEALHIRLNTTEDGPRQIFQPKLEWLMAFIDVSDDADPAAAAHVWMTADLARPMDLVHGPLFLYALIEQGPRCFMWYLVYHHIVMDANGYSLVAYRMAQVYTALVTERPCPGNGSGSLRALVDNDRVYRESEQYTHDRAYWLKRFADHPEPTRLVARSSSAPEHQVSQMSCLSPLSMDILTAVAHRTGVRWSRVVIAATALCVHRLTGARDVILGFPVTAGKGWVSRRVHPGINPLQFRCTERL